MTALRKYQLDIIALSIVVITAIGILFFGLQKMKLDPRQYEWPIAGPLIFIYGVYLLSIRKKIPTAEKRKLSGSTLIYWLILGIGVFAGYKDPIAAGDYWTINVFFLISGLFLADSYWDFKKISLKKIIKFRKNPDKV